MTPEYLYRRHIALASNPSKDAPYGQGFNCVVEIACKPGLDSKIVIRAFQQTLNRIDHKALGVDVELGVATSLPSLAQWLGRELAAAGIHTLQSLSFERGDGYRVLITT